MNVPLPSDMVVVVDDDIPLLLSLVVVAPDDVLLLLLFSEEDEPSALLLLLRDDDDDDANDDVCGGDATPRVEYADATNDDDAYAHGHARCSGGEQALGRDGLQARARRRKRVARTVVRCASDAGW